MKKIALTSLLLLILLFLVHFLFLTKKQTATIDKHQFTIEIAQTLKDQEIGLSKYASIPVNKGMYFTFSHPDLYRFWMKNMHFPIDIIYIQNNRIVDIFSNVPAPKIGQTSLPTYGPSSPADAVLEINAGLSEKYGFKKGDTVQLTQ